MLQCFALPASPALLFGLGQLHLYLDHLCLSGKFGSQLLFGLHQCVFAGEVTSQRLALGLQEYLGLAVSDQLALLLPINNREQARSLSLFQHPKINMKVMRFAELQRLSIFELSLR